MSDSILTQGDTKQQTLLITPVTASKLINEDNNLVVATYNSQGHGLGHIDYISEVLNKSDLLLWHEQLDQVVIKFGDMNVSCHRTSGMDKSVIPEGRPYRGLSNNVEVYDDKCCYQSLSLHQQTYIWNSNLT